MVDDDIDITTLFDDVLCENVLEASVYAFNDPIDALKHFNDNKENYALIISDYWKKWKRPIQKLELFSWVGTAGRMTQYIWNMPKRGVIDTSIEKPVKYLFKI